VSLFLALAAVSFDFSIAIRRS